MRDLALIGSASWLEGTFDYFGGQIRDGARGGRASMTGPARNTPSFDPPS